MWVFFAGYGRSGKDTATKYVVDNYGGFEKMAFADGVRDKAKEENKFFPELNETYCEVIKRIGYEDAKMYQCIRDYLVEIGHGYRSKYGEFVWIDLLNKKADMRACGGKSLPLVVSDCRYLNEETYGRNRGKFILIRIKRKGCKAKHVTEAATIKELTPDYVVRNDGSIVEFYEKIKTIMDAESVVKMMLM